MYSSSESGYQQQQQNISSSVPSYNHQNPPSSSALFINGGRGQSHPQHNNQTASFGNNNNNIGNGITSQGGMAYPHPENGGGFVDSSRPYSHHTSNAAYPKRYPSAAPPQQQHQLGRSNSISSNHHHHQAPIHHRNLDGASNVNDFSSTSATAHAGTSTYSRRRVPSVESFRSAVPSPYMGSQVGGPNPRYQQHNPNASSHHQYAASEYTPSSIPRDRAYVRGNNDYSSRHSGAVAPPADSYSRPAPTESYNNAYSSHPQGRPNDSYRDSSNRPGYDRPQSRAPSTYQSLAPPAPASEAGYRTASAYPTSSSYKPTPQHQGNFGSSSAVYQAQPQSETVAARPDSRIASTYDHPNNRNYDNGPAIYDQQRAAGYNTQPQHQSNVHDANSYRPPSSRPDQVQHHHTQEQSYPYQQPHHSQEPLRVYKSRSTMSLKTSAHPSSPAVASSMAPSQNHVSNAPHFVRKGSMDEKQALPESLRTHSKKIEGLLHSSAANHRSASTGDDLLNLQNLQVIDPIHSLHKEMYALIKDTSALVLSRGGGVESLSAADYNVLHSNLNMLVQLVDRALTV